MEGEESRRMEGGERRRMREKEEELRRERGRVREREGEERGLLSSSITIKKVFPCENN